MFSEIPFTSSFSPASMLLSKTSEISFIILSFDLVDNSCENDNPFILKIKNPINIRI